MRIAIVRAVSMAALPTLGFLAAAPHQAHAQALIQSHAFTMSADFTEGGITSSLGPVTPVQGSAPPNYDQVARLATLHQTLVVDSASPQTSLTVSASGLKSHVGSSLLTANIATDEADSFIRAADLTLTDAPGAAPLLQITGSNIESHATHRVMLINQQIESGGAAIGSLKISGSLVGDKPLSFGGPVAFDTILYQTATVEITLGQRIEKAILPIGCPIVCGLLKYDISVAAVTVTLHRARIGNRLVTGTIVLGESFAGPPSLPLGLARDLAD